MSRPPERRNAIEAFLLARQGQFVAAAEIARAVYGADDYDTVQAVKRTLSRIRLESAHLRLDRAVGYRVIGTGVTA